ncbi:hypothetical protein BVH03_17755 [Pseudomonas sp. PA15(2017)]|nr:hypothetical protein BVH03_17755 [Pseudomonas sp. PA15(2017)]
MGVLVVLQLGQFAWLSAMQYATWNSTKSADRIMNQVEGFSSSIDALESTQADLKQSLETANANNAQLGSVEARLSEVEATTRSLGRSQADTSELRVVIAAQLEQLTEDFIRLKKATSPSPKPVVQPQKRPVPAASARVAKQPSKPIPAPPPFVLLGIETRAGEAFASVAREGAASLDEIQLLRAGEAYQNWKLIRLDNNSAAFLASGEERVVSVR